MSPTNYILSLRIRFGKEIATCQHSPLSLYYCVQQNTAKVYWLHLKKASLMSSRNAVGLMKNEGCCSLVKLPETTFEDVKKLTERWGGKSLRGLL